MAKTIDQQIAETEAKLARLKQKERSKETRRKIIAGSMLLKSAMADASIARWLLAQIEAAPQRDRDDMAIIAEKLRTLIAATGTAAG